ncbi:thioredoxin family protein [Alkalibacillus haloalkaliphilus]|uniref:thioredoxin family protein n=1 Tax=Alkalibacillus haloalkaliphilus TaxID=94136 RepID=UPI0002D8BEA1|nr:thioredoxin family protein [Alkalibacillus haloalkaliphilus]
MKTEEQYFQEGITLQQYMSQMSKLQEESFNVYENFQLPNDSLVEELKGQSLHFLIITEDWCGDAMMINPIIRHLAEAADIEARVVMRDDDPNLIDRHLTNGGRAIPIVLIINDEGVLVGKWGPRAPEVQQLVDDYRDSFPPKDDPNFETKQKEMIKILTKRYSEDSTLWNYVYDSIKVTLHNISIKK